MHETPLPESADPDQALVAFIVDDYTMPPAQPGWLLIFHRTEADPATLLDSLCLATAADGARLFSRLRQGSLPGRYHLEAPDGSRRIEDAEVVSALPLAAMTPGRRGR